MADPLDKQLVEAVLSSRPRRSEARARGGEAGDHAARGGRRPRPPRWPTRRPTLDEDDDEDFDLSADEDAEPGAAAARRSRSSSEEAVEGVKVPADMEAPAKLSADEVDEPTTRGARGRARPPT